MEAFSFNPPINLSVEGKWLIAVTTFEATNSVINMSNGDKSYSISTPSFWNPKGVEETINKRENYSDFRSQNDIEWHLKEVERRVTRLEIENSGYSSAGFDHLNVKYLKK